MQKPHCSPDGSDASRDGEPPRQSRSRDEAAARKALRGASRRDEAAACYFGAQGHDARFLREYLGKPQEPSESQDPLRQMKEQKRSAGLSNVMRIFEELDGASSGGMSPCGGA